MNIRLRLLLVLSIVPPGTPVLAADRDPLSLDEHMVQNAHVGTDGPSLLEFFRRRTPDDAGRNKLHTLIRRLGDSSFSVRETASRDLLSLGSVAAPALRQAARDPDLEVAHRAEECLQQIDMGAEAALDSAAARLVSVRKPPGAAAVLLAYLPFSENPAATAQVKEALAAVALRDGKPEAVLVGALQDPSPVKRAAAAEALCRAGVAGQVSTLPALLHDPDATVRLQVALALAFARDRDAVPVLIDLLNELPSAQAYPAEDLLRRLAQGQAPAVTLSADPAGRRKCRDAWAAWWRDHGPRVELSNLERVAPPLGFTLVVLLDKGQVMEFTAGRQLRWAISGLGSPLDAQTLPGDRVLITEFDTHRVTERNIRGEVLWEKKTPQSPLAAQRLPNGDTFIVTHERLMEVDPAGKEVFEYAGGASITTARKFHDGRIACILDGGKYRQLDATGKVLKEFAVSPAVQTTSALDVMPNGGILFAVYGDKKVTEYDPDGAVVWQVEVDSPISATRLPDGHTLVSSQTDRLIEFDRSGKVVWEQAVAGHPTLVRRR